MAATTIESMWELDKNGAGNSSPLLQYDLRVALRVAHGSGLLFAFSSTAVALNMHLPVSPSSVFHGGQFDTMYPGFGKVLLTSLADDTILGVGESTEPKKRHNDAWMGPALWQDEENDWILP